MSLEMVRNGLKKFKKMALAHLYGLILTFLDAAVLNMLVVTTLHTQFYVGQELLHFTHSLAGLI